MTCLLCGNKGWVVRYLRVKPFLFEVGETPSISQIEVFAEECRYSHCMAASIREEKKIKMEIANANIKLRKT